MSSNLTDITTIVAVESLFKKGPRDPWARMMAGRVADLFVYSDSLRYVLPMPEELPMDKYPGRPSLILKLQDFYPKVVYPEKYSTDFNPNLQDEYLLSVFDAFHLWASSNQERLGWWIQLHSMPWIRDGHTSRVGRQYVFNVERLKEGRLIDSIAKKIGVNTDRFLYAFDVVLRYPLYGMLAGEDNYYVHHPIRNAFRLPGSSFDPAPTPKVCVSFQKSVSEMASSLSQEQYLKLLIDLRKVVRDQGLHELPPGEVEEQVVRAIAQKVKLTPYLKEFSRKAAIVGGVVAGLGAIPILGPAAAILGGSIAVLANIWSGKLPREVASWKWLEWTMKWKIEEDLKDS